MSATDSPPRREHVGRSRRGWTLFSLRGVPVRIDASWFVIAAIVTYIFYERMSVTLGASGPVIILGSALVAALLFFASLLAHELGHAFTSLDRGLPVLSITLFLMGGVTESTREAKTAKDEFVIVGIGPFISLVLAAAFGLAHAGVQPAQPFAAIFGYLAWTNLLLAIFNLVPGYPLDGGRLLRAVLWGATGNPHRSTRWAARVGQVFAGALIVFGAWVLFRTQGGFNGLWEIVIGIFLFRGAAEAHARARLQERLATLTAAEVMGSMPPVLDPQLLLHQAILELETRPSLVWAVGDPLVGTVSLPDVDAVPRRLWATTALAQITHDPSRSAIAANESMTEVLARIVEAPRQQLVVVDGDRPVGLLTPSLVTAPTRRDR